jgi:hypothetical protein
MVDNQKKLAHVFKPGSGAYPSDRLSDLLLEDLKKHGRVVYYRGPVGSMGRRLQEAAALLEGQGEAILCQAPLERTIGRREHRIWDYIAIRTKASIMRERHVDQSRPTQTQEADRPGAA